MDSEKEKVEVLQPYEVYRLTLDHYVDNAGSRVRLEEPLTVQMVIEPSCTASGLFESDARYDEGTGVDNGGVRLHELCARLHRR